jgi:hypothetical protein
MNHVERKAEELRRNLGQELGEIELDVIGNYTIADAIREGSTVTKQAYAWSEDECEKVCTWSAAVIAAKSRGYM